jgi:hypothetical protein
MMKKEQKQGLFPQVYSGRRLAQLLQELRLTLLRLASDWQLLCRVLCFHVTRVSGARARLSRDILTRKGEVFALVLAGPSSAWVAGTDGRWGGDGIV